MLDQLGLVKVLLAVAIIEIFNWAEVQAVGARLAFHLVAHDRFNSPRILVARITIRELAAHYDILFEYLLQVAVEAESFHGIVR